MESRQISPGCPSMHPQTHSAAASPADARIVATNAAVIIFRMAATSLTKAASVPHPIPGAGSLYAHIYSAGDRAAER
jgi:hypothetical protein